jgi:hypothetical protein
LIGQWHGEKRIGGRYYEAIAQLIDGGIARFPDGSTLRFDGQEPGLGNFAMLLEVSFLEKPRFSHSWSFSVDNFRAAYHAFTGLIEIDSTVFGNSFSVSRLGWSIDEVLENLIAKGKGFSSHDILFKSGVGSRTHSTGGFFEGQWINNKLHGKGVMVSANGSRRYEGDWSRGIIHGKGIMEFADGCRYDGDWETNQKHGKGIMEFADGGRYEGDWSSDKRHGKGAMVFADGSRYEGDWSKDMRTGQGNCVWPSGVLYEGEWKSDCRQGPGVWVSPNGDRYDREWSEESFVGDGLDGIFTMIDATGVSRKAYWFEGRQYVSFAAPLIVRMRTTIRTLRETFRPDGPIGRDFK